MSRSQGDDAVAEDDASYITLGQHPGLTLRLFVTEVSDGVRGALTAVLKSFTVRVIAMLLAATYVLLRCSPNEGAAEIAREVDIWAAYGCW